MVSLIYAFATCVLDIQGVFHSIQFYSSSERAKSGWSSVSNQSRLNFCYPPSLLVYIQCALRSLLARCWLQRSRFLDPWSYRRHRHPLQFLRFTLRWGKGGWDVPEYAGCVWSCDFYSTVFSNINWSRSCDAQQLRTRSLNKSQENSEHTQRGWSESWKKWWTSGGICPGTNRLVMWTLG